MRRDDFKISNDEKLPGVSSLLDGLSRIHSIEKEQGVEDTDQNSEVNLYRRAAAVKKSLQPVVGDTVQM